MSGDVGLTMLAMMKRAHTTLQSMVILPWRQILKLKVKIIGSGGAAQKHARAFAELKDLYTVTDCQDYDIVDICTPNYLHYQQACDSLNAGCHAIVEKPICGSLAECDILAGIEERTGKKIIPIFQYRFAGHEKLSRCIVNRWKRDRHYWTGWRGTWAEALGGCVTSHGIHAIDLAIQHCGMPLMVAAEMNASLWPETFSDLFIGDPSDMLRIVTITSPNVITGGFDWGDQHRGFTMQLSLTHQALTSGTPLPVTLAEARQSIEVVTAAYYSAYSGDAVMLPIEPVHPFYGGWSGAMAARAEYFSGKAAGKTLPALPQK